MTPDESSFPASPLDVEHTLRLMDVADQLRREQSEHRELVDTVEVSGRERMREHLLRMYEELGETIDPALVDQAIDTFLAEEHRFVPPEPGLATSLARLYVRRSALARRYGVPLVAISLAFTVAGLFAWSAQRFVDGREERSVEASVSETYRRHAELTRTLAELAGEPLVEELSTSERSAFDRALSSARADFDRAEAFLGDYAPGGSPDEAVTGDNYEEVGELLVPADAAIAAAASNLSTADGIVANLRRLSQLGPESDRLLSTIRALAREPGAVDEAEAAHAEAAAFLAAGSAPQLASAVERLREIATQLERAFRVVIEGGVWRYQDDDPNVRNYYLRVRAVGADGSAFSFRVKNEETGEMVTVSEWAERVDKAVYDRVAADKQDNGLIDDDTFAAKARGFLTIDRAYPDLGQITRW